MKLNEVIIKPVLTEKATQKANNKVYTFEINPQANKTKVKEVIEKLFKVKVESVRIINRQGKMRRSGRKMIQKKMANRKIALIGVKEGKIEIFPQT